MRYGQPEPWKDIKSKIGRTKPHRAPEERRRDSKKSDGRPPDTSRQLLANSKRKKKKANDGDQTRMANCQSYCWDKNSCWIDTALELIFQTVNRDFTTTFGPLFANTPQTNVMWPLYQAMDLRHTIENDPDHTNMAIVLGNQRDGFRKFLKSERIIKFPFQFNSLFVRYIVRYSPLCYLLYLF